MKAVRLDPASMMKLMENPAAPWNRPVEVKPKLEASVGSVGINPRRCPFCPEVIFSDRLREVHISKRHRRPS